MCCPNSRLPRVEPRPGLPTAVAGRGRWLGILPTAARVAFAGQRAAVQSQDQVFNHLNEDLDDTIATADESFEQDQLAEPSTWINYLGELGDLIYAQLRHFYEWAPESPFAARQADSQRDKPASSTKLLEQVDDLLDDFYYDQYENSQVLYYGAQLARQGDTVEIGCYLPRDQPAEWTKSGHLVSQQSGAAAQLASSSSHLQDSPRWLSVVRRSEFLASKQNFSLKIFEAQPSNSGNYRCNRMSRKYHKLVVVPARLGPGALFATQQRLLRLIRRPQAQSARGPQAVPMATGDERANLLQAALEHQAPIWSGQAQTTTMGDANNSGIQAQTRASSKQNHLGGEGPTLLPGHIIAEGQAMLVHCNISDEFVLRRLREQPRFQLAWYKNGRLLRASQPHLQLQQQQHQSSQQHPATQPRSGANVSPATSTQAQQQFAALAGRQSSQSAGGAAGQRIQFLGPNGRQMYISAALFSDAGDYLCSWSRLPARQVSDYEAAIGFNSTRFAL